MEGVEKCPNSEDVWLEAVRLQTPDNAKAVLARGVAANPSSVQLWLQAAKLESETAGEVWWEAGSCMEAWLTCRWC